MRIIHDGIRLGHSGRMFLGPLAVIAALLVGWAIIANWHQLPSAFMTTVAQLS